MGLEKQILEMVSRSDKWIRRDIKEQTEWELDQHRLAKYMVGGNINHKEILALYMYPYNQFFSKHLKRVPNYRKYPYFDGIIVTPKATRLSILQMMLKKQGLKSHLGRDARNQNALHWTASVFTTW